MGYDVIPLESMIRMVRGDMQEYQFKRLAQELQSVASLKVSLAVRQGITSFLRVTIRSSRRQGSIGGGNGTVVGDGCDILVLID